MAGIRQFANTRTITPAPPASATEGPIVLSNEELTAETASLETAVDVLENRVSAIGLVQAGTVTASASSGTVTFPVAFATAPVVTVSPRYTGSGGPYSVPTVNSVTATGFTWGNMVTRRHYLSGGNLQDSAEALGISPGLTWMAKGT